VPEHQIVETLIEEAMRIAEEAGEAGETVPAGSPVVTVS
jgi:(E)-4-hydroxy-3-methylbut-2-enyl-diphosphate synthase